jgi:hypothetical protein
MHVSPTNWNRFAEPMGQTWGQRATGNGGGLTVAGWQGRTEQVRSEKLRRRARNAVSRRRLSTGPLKSPSDTGLARPVPTRCELAHNRGSFFRMAWALGFPPRSTNRSGSQFLLDLPDEVSVECVNQKPSPMSYPGDGLFRGHPKNELRGVYER